MSSAILSSTPGIGFGRRTHLLREAASCPHGARVDWRRPMIPSDDPERRPSPAMMRVLLGAWLCCSLVLIAPRSSLARDRADAGFVDSGTVTYLTPRGPSDIDPASIVVAASNVIFAANLDEGLVTF